MGIENGVMGRVGGGEIGPPMNQKDIRRLHCLRVQTVKHAPKTRGIHAALLRMLLTSAANCRCEHNHRHPRTTSAVGSAPLAHCRGVTTILSTR